MYFSRPFISAILFSAFVHAAIFFTPTNFKLFARQIDYEIKISYLKLLKEAQKEISVRGQPLPKQATKTKLQQTAPPPYVDKADLLKAYKDTPLLPRPSFSKPTFIKPDIIEIKKKIVVPPIDIHKINNPIYIGYYQLVREKIRHAAYNNFAQAEEGEVYLTFTLSADGYIQAIHLVEEKSSASSYLRKVSLTSMRAASPFPAFPKELDYPQLTFNVIISFEIE